MHQVKSLVKKILPAGLRNRVANFYHLLEAVAANIRHGFPGHSAQVIMITGTNGKTTTAVYVVKVLEAAGYKVGASTTALYQAGSDVRLNDRNMTVDNAFRLQALLAQMKKAKCDYMVIEVTSHALVQHRVWGIPCDVAVMTNLSQDHLDYHKTMENYAAAKGKLFARRPRLIVLNRDDEWFDYFNQFQARERKITYGASPDATCRITNVALHPNGSNVDLRLDGTINLRFHTDLIGKFNVYNAAAAAAVGYFLQLEPADIATGIANVHAVPGRMEKVNEGQPFTVLVDYAHTPDALDNLLAALKHLTKNRLIVVFGATGNRDRGKRPIMGEVVAKYADKIFLTDDEPYDEDPAAIRLAVMQGLIKAGAQRKTKEVGDRRKAIAAAITTAQKDDVIVLAGMGHEQFRIVAGKRLPWNDAQAARTILRKQ